MMIDLLEGFLARQSASFDPGGEEAALSDYDFPLPVIWPQGRRVFARPQEYLDKLGPLHAECRRMGARRLEVQLRAQELPRDGRFRLWLLCSYLSETGETVAVVDKTLFCRDRGHRICVEMVELSALRGAPLAGLRKAPRGRQAR